MVFAAGRKGEARGAAGCGGREEARGEPLGPRAALRSLPHIAQDRRRRNFNLFLPPKSLTALPDARINLTIGEANAHGRVPITLRSSRTALYVTMTTLAAGRFERNTFMLHAGTPTVVEFLPWAGFDEAVLRRSLRVESLASYMPTT